MTKNNDIIWLTEVDSTNKYVKSNIDSLDNLSVVSALSQTAGRGQGDHTWQSEPGQNLLFSILLKEPDVAPNCQKVISDAVAESMVKLLEKHGIEAWIKPPNDIWVRDKKICGTSCTRICRLELISQLDFPFGRGRFIMAVRTAFSFEPTVRGFSCLSDKWN